ncbi:uncharacterized protein [Ptychodera flava]|uniref:uncharacterized protein n=1 Tax=Ptychodera flava TaxID=63121 RepID=UPI00396A0BFF
MRVVALISGGKDSCYNMMQCVAEGHEIVALANLRPNKKDEIDSYMFQSVGHDGIDLYAQAMDLPLYRRTIFGEAIVKDKDYVPDPMDEVEDLFQLLHNIKRHVDFEAVSVGAVLSDYQRTRVESVCSRLGLVSLAYLWRRDQQELLLEMILCQVKAIVIKIAALGLEPSKHLGKSIEEIYPHMVEMKLKYGLNVCGEGGEYETFTLDCPLFKKKIVLYESEKVLHSDNPVTPVAYLKLKNINLEDKPLDQSQNMRDAILDLPMKRSSTLLRDLFGQMEMPQQIESSNVPLRTLFCKVKEHQRRAFVQRLVCESSSHGYLCMSGVSPAGEGKTQDVKEITKTAMEQLKVTLEKHGMDMSDIFLVHLYIKDMSEFKAINSAYCQYFSLNPPARVCVQVDLPSDRAIQIDCYAYKPPLPSTSTSDHQPLSKTTMHVQSLSHWAPSNIGPYSQATQIGNVCFVAGQIGLCPASMELIEGGIRPQARLSARNAQRIIKAMHPGMDLSSAMQVVCYVTDSRFISIAEQEWQYILESSEMMSGYNDDSAGCSGLMTYVVVANLPKNALVEWHVIAHTNKQTWKYSKHTLKDWSNYVIDCENCLCLEDSLCCLQLSVGVCNEDNPIDLKDMLDKSLDVLKKEGLPWKQMMMMRVFYHSRVFNYGDLYTVLEDSLENRDDRIPPFSLVPANALAEGALLTACCWMQG